MKDLKKLFDAFALGKLDWQHIAVIASTKQVKRLTATVSIAKKDG